MTRRKKLTSLIYCQKAEVDISPLYFIGFKKTTTEELLQKLLREFPVYGEAGNLGVSVMGDSVTELLLNREYSLAIRDGLIEADF